MGFSMAASSQRPQVQAWALNSLYYQSRIPMKDAALMARAEDPELRRIWRQRIIDHDGNRPQGGRHRALAGPDRRPGPGPRLCRLLPGPSPRHPLRRGCLCPLRGERSLLEAVASSLTEMFAPAIITDRVAGMLANYDFISRDALAYFDKRLTQAPRDADFALNYVKREARRPDQQQAVIQALIFKCDVLWSQLDALHYAYVEPGHVPPGAFTPDAAAATATKALLRPRSRTDAAEDSVPRLAPGVRLKFDAARDCWVVLAPERVIMPDETALEILRLCDGNTSLGAVIDELAAGYDAPRDLIAADVRTLVAELDQNGIVRL